MTLPPKSPVVGTPVSMTSYGEVLEAFDHPGPDRALIVAVCNVHSVMSARRDPHLRRAIDGAAIATPDGVPLVWALRWMANPDQQRVYGPDLMRNAFIDSAGHGWKHFLYGSTPETLERLAAAVAEMAPDAEIVGMVSPPFAAPDESRDVADAEEIRRSGADIVWVGLGMPKQELWMERQAERLPGIVLVGVGAAFDFLAGVVEEAPPWMMRMGLEWLFRLAKEPRRLWRRYAWNNPAFVVLLVRQLVAQRIRRSGADGHKPAGDR